MSVAVWVITGLLAVPFLLVGAMKTLLPSAALASKGIGWAQDVAPALVKFIGVSEVAGALGMVLPVITGVAPFLAPAAAIGLCCVQASAIAFHLRRREFRALPVNAALLCLAGFVAVGRVLGY